MTKLTGLIAFIILNAGVSAWAGEGPIFFDEFAGQYFQRSDTVTPSAGNAQAVNTVTHMIDPWPPYAYNRRIPADGERMVGAVERYRRNLPAPPPISQSGSGTSSAVSTTAATGAGATTSTSTGR
jgi:hypothetical protein